MRPLIAFIFASAIVAAPAFAWDLRKEADRVWTTETVGDSSVALICNRRHAGRLEFHLNDMTGGEQDRGSIRNVVFSIKLPDGRTDHWPISVGPEGPVLTGLVSVSDFNLDFFANGESMEVTEAGTGQVLFRSGMRGTGAARIAFQERCGT